MQGKVYTNPGKYNCNNLKIFVFIFSLGSRSAVSDNNQFVCRGWHRHNASCQQTSIPQSAHLLGWIGRWLVVRVGHIPSVASGLPILFGILRKIKQGKKKN